MGVESRDGMASNHWSGREKYKLWGKPLAQPCRQETSQLPGPFRQEPLAGFLPGPSQSSDVTWLSFWRAGPTGIFNFPISMWRLVLLNAHLHRRNSLFQMPPCVPPEKHTDTRSFIHPGELGQRKESE